MPAPPTACSPARPSSACRIHRFEKLIITDTIPQPPEKRIPKIEVLSVAPMLAEGIRRIHADQSLSTIFDRFWVQETR